jgi:hypothetical protein
MVQPGHFVVHDAVRPPLTDGDYQLVVSQALSVDGSSIDPIVRSFRVTGPRYALPPDQILSVFPPSNGTGAFDDRLPQIVLKRRTLPYERLMSTSDDLATAPPWLALVVLADGEGQFVHGQPLDPSLPEPDDTDASTRDVLRVSARVVQAVFPTKGDLPWLTHVREVDLSDTELALGDDDGWMAVVIANRLPVPGPPAASGGPLSPRHYTAFLVSLEGHEADLPTSETMAEPQFGFTTSHVYTDAEVAQAVQAARQAQRSPLQTLPEAYLASQASAVPAVPAGGSGATSASLTGRTFASTRSSQPPDAWSASPSFPAAAPAAGGTTAGGTASSVQAYAAPTFALNGITNASALKGLSVNPASYDPQERILEFTVLTSWSFTSQPEGDFEWLMTHLDVGMLGTPPQPPPPPPAQQPPPDSRPPLVVLDTGHLKLSALSRRGEPSSVWYRGPCTPRAVLRPAATDPAGILAHAADQLRQVGPDGSENESLAIAFEIGRMLVAAQPGVIAALLDWRTRGYGQARFASVLANGGTALYQQLAAVLAAKPPVYSAGVAAGVLAGLGANGGTRLGPTRPLVGSAPVTGTGAALAAVVSEGFGLDAGQVASVLGAAGVSPAAAAGIPAQLTQPSAVQALGHLGAPDFAATALGLQGQVRRTAGALATGVLGSGALVPGEVVPADSGTSDGTAQQGREP